MTYEEKVNMGIIDIDEFRQTSPFTGKRCTKRSKKWLNERSVKDHMSLFKLVNDVTDKPVGNEFYEEFIDIKTSEHYLIKIK